MIPPFFYLAEKLMKGQKEMTAILQLLNPNNTLSTNRPLAHAIGLNEAIAYGALLAKAAYYERIEKLDDGWFYSTIPDLEESTALSGYQQRNCIANLVKIGLIESKNRGLPARRCFRIIEDLELLKRLLSEGIEKGKKLKPTATYSYEKKRKSSFSAFSEAAEQVTDFDEDDCSACNDNTAEQDDAYSEVTKGDFYNHSNCETSYEETSEQGFDIIDEQLQRNCEAISEETADLYFIKTKDNKTRDNNPSINQSKDGDRMDRIDEQRTLSFLEEREAYLETIKENIDYEILVQQKDRRDASRIDEILNLMLDVICSKSEFIRVNGENCPKEVVKSRFLKLNSEHIDYVLMAMDKSASDIRNIRSYLITALYNAPITIDTFFSAMVNYDFHGK